MFARGGWGTGGGHEFRYGNPGMGLLAGIPKHFLGRPSAQDDIRGIDLRALIALVRAIKRRARPVRSCSIQFFTLALNSWST